MRLSLFLLLGALLGATTTQAQTKSTVTSSSLDESEVRITYGELKRLVAATLPEPAPSLPKPVPPVPAALLSASYDLDVAQGVIVAEMQVESFDTGWHAIPLTGSGTGAIAVEAPDARVVVHEDRLCLLTEKAAAYKVKLTFALAPEGQETTLALAPSAVASLQATGLPAGRVLQIRHGGATTCLTKSGTTALPASGGDVTFIIEEARPDLQPSVNSPLDDAIITAATYTTEVVRDGAVLTEGAITIRHDLPARLTIQFPAAAKLLQCHVNGAPVRPVPHGESGFEIPLDDPATDGAESEVKLSFTQAFPPLQPAEGELSLALPQSPLFARQIDWAVRLPVGYDLSFSGNVDQVAAPSTSSQDSSGLHLRKSLCRDQQPTARIIYRKH